MIMQGRQVTRFLKLFDSLMAFCARDLEVPDLVAPSKNPLDGPDMDKVIEAVWGEGGDRTVIGRFVEANPDGLNRTDLREVESWKLGLFTDFPVMREGGNVYFMLGGYAFAVRGLDYEIDKDSECIPCFLTTLLVPFDGLITYGLTLVYSDAGLDHRFFSGLEELLDECKAEGHIVRTSRQFLKVAPLALEEELRCRREAEKLLKGGSLFGPDTHEGVLAGLTAEERRKAISEYADKLMPLSEDHFIRMFDGKSYVCAPKDSFREFLAAQTMKGLRSLMERLDITSSSSRGGKAQLVREILDTETFEIGDIASEIIRGGAKVAEEFRDVFEAGGRIVVPDSEVTSPDALPQPVVPYLMLFHDGGEFCAQIFQETMDALDAAYMANIVERARAIDAVIDYVSLAVDLRGAMRFADAVTEAVDVLGLEELESEQARLVVAGIMNVRRNDGVLDFNIVECDEKLYLVAYGLLDAENLANLDEGDEERLGHVLEDQGLFEPRPVEDLLGTYQNAYKWMENTSEYRSLMVFFDAHVPDGANDYAFADNALEQVFDCSRFAYDTFIDDVLDILSTLGYVPADDGERERVVGLLEDFYEATPKWQTGGWSLKEMEAHAL